MCWGKQWLYISFFGLPQRWRWWCCPPPTSPWYPTDERNTSPSICLWKNITASVSGKWVNVNSKHLREKQYLILALNNSISRLKQANNQMFRQTQMFCGHILETADVVKLERCVWCSRVGLKSFIHFWSFPKVYYSIFWCNTSIKACCSSI